MSRYTEVGNDTALERYAVDETVVFTVFTPAPTASLPAATLGPGIIYDTTANKLKLSNGTAWETVTSA